MNWFSAHANPILSSIVYSVLGIVILLLAYLAAQKLLPFSIRKEIEEDHNIALGIILAAFILGISMIIAAVIG